MYYFPLDPPYFMLIAGLFMGITSGLAFQATLKEKIKGWAKNPQGDILDYVKGWGLQLPFIGITVGIGMFLTSGLAVFGFPNDLAYAIALPLTLLTTSLVWAQLNSLFVLLGKEGSKGMDLDSI